MFQPRFKKNPLSKVSPLAATVVLTMFGLACTI